MVVAKADFRSDSNIRENYSDIFRRLVTPNRRNADHGDSLLICFQMFQMVLFRSFQAIPGISSGFVCLTHLWVRPVDVEHLCH